MTGTDLSNHASAQFSRAQSLPHKQKRRRALGLPAWRQSLSASVSHPRCATYADQCWRAASPRRWIAGAARSGGQHQHHFWESACLLGVRVLRNLSARTYACSYSLQNAPLIWERYGLGDAVGNVGVVFQLRQAAGNVEQHHRAGL